MSNQGVMHLRGTVPLTASEQIAVNLLVEDHTVAGQMSLCPAGGCPLGVNYVGTVASAAVGDVQLIAQGDIVYSLGSASIAIGDYVKAAASGQVAPEASVAVRTAFTIGVALSVCSGAAAGFYWRAV